MADEVLSQFTQQVDTEAKVDTSKKLKVGIIGTGWIAESHIQSYKNMPDVEVVAAADLIPGKAEAFAKRGNGASGAPEPLPKVFLEKFVLCLAPFAPHLGEELWQFLGHDTTLAYEPWPAYDPMALVEDEVEIPVQVMGKLRGRIKVPTAATPDEMRAAAEASPDVAKFLEGKTVVKVIAVPKRMVNFVVK